MDQRNRPVQRYTRLKLIPWWNQDTIATARVLVVGAGAIGNEVLKNLALLGFGRVLIVDFDTIEDSNLARSVLFRASDLGRSKAEVAAARMREINPDTGVAWSTASIIDGVGLGVFRRMNLVIGALDNREARLAVSRACWKVGVPFIDTGIQAIDGQVRVFDPRVNSPCYECTLTESDWEVMRYRRSCQLLKPDTPFPAVPTTPTIASVIGGLAVQEALKLLHPESGFPSTAGRGIIFHGPTLRTTEVHYQHKPDCPSHDHHDRIESYPGHASSTTLGQLLDFSRKFTGRKGVLDLDREIVHFVIDPDTGKRIEILRPLSQVTHREAVRNGAVMDLQLLHTIDGSENFLRKTVAEMGIPPFDILTARRGIEEYIGIELTGDCTEVFSGFCGP